jgi:hypothetical protein
MKRIDEYIENIYKGFDEKDEETKILKEEMKSHLYDEVNDLIKEGYSEEQSIQLAVSHFGDENNVSNEMKSIITKQTKYTNILLKLSIIVLIISQVIASNYPQHIKIGLDFTVKYIHLPLIIVVPIITLAVYYLKIMIKQL